MDPIQIQQFKERIKQQVRGVQRFKLNLALSVVEELLDACYQEIVSRRRIKFAADVTYKSYLKMCSRWLSEDHKPGLMLYGNYGAGKTTMGKAIAELVNNLGYPMRSITARDIANLAAIDPEAFNSLKREQRLYIDEVGREPLVAKNYGNDKNPFIEMIEYRYDKQLFTVLTANLTDEEIIDRYGIYIDERISENFEKINYENKFHFSTC